MHPGHGEACSQHYTGRKGMLRIRQRAELNGIHSISTMPSSFTVTVMPSCT